MFLKYFSNQVEFRDDDHSESLVEGRRNAETEFVRTPVERADWLRAQGHVLEKVNRPRNSHVHAVAVLRHALGRVGTESNKRTKKNKTFILTRNV